MLINALSFGTSFGGSGGGAGGPARLGGGSGVAGSSGAKSTAFSAPGSGGGNWAMGTKGAKPRRSHGGHGENDSGTEVDQLICWIMLGMDWWFFEDLWILILLQKTIENQWHAIDLGLLSAPPAFLTTVDVTAYKPRNLNLNSSQRWDLKALNLQKLQFQGIGLKTLQLNEMSEMPMVYAICAAVSKVE